MQRVCTEVLQYQSKVLSLVVLENVVGHNSPNTLWHFPLATSATLTAWGWFTVISAFVCLCLRRAVTCPDPYRWGKEKQEFKL